MARPKVEKPKVVVAFSIDDDVNDDINLMAVNMGISKSAVVNMVLRGVCFQETEILKELGKALAKQKRAEKVAARHAATA